ncbi:hypothetical protein ACFYOF_06365 [Streptomyces sp. NPDC007148]|uniref:hypothetical protein n=1 Tax=unclassified Streptomyces TaxID=2593676 RepID=UPI0036A96CEA
MDWKWTITAVLPVVSLILGAWLNQLSEGRREAAALKREQKIRELDREQAGIDRREAFELTHLAEVNAVLARLFTAALRCHDHVTDDEPLGEHGVALMESNREITRLKALIIDDDLRSLVSQAHREANRLSMSRAEGYTQVPDAHALVEAAQEALSVRLREIYGSSPRRVLRP